MKEVSEGKCRFHVPDVAKPEEGEVFYNPVMEMNRDISIGVYSAYAGLRNFCDLLTASGIRAVRVAKEVGLPVTACDRAAEAVELAKKNAEANGVEIDFFKQDANEFLARRFFDALDLDPFGTPVPFLDLAVQNTRRLLAVTATDTAPLCGVYPRVSWRRYGSRATKVEALHEFGLRNLVGYCVRAGARYDVGLRPLLCYYSDHYYRAYFESGKGAGRADTVLEQVGHYGKLGPVWLGKLWDKGFCETVLEEVRRRDFARAVKLLERIVGEADGPAWYRDFHKACSRAGTNPPKFEKFLEGLKKEGFFAARTHFSLTGFRTDASDEKIGEALMRPGGGDS